MARRTASRKYQLTINNSIEKGFDHDSIKRILSGFTGIEYWSMCDEIGNEETPHTHVYAVFSNAVMFATLQKRFYLKIGDQLWERFNQKDKLEQGRAYNLIPSAAEGGANRYIKGFAFYWYD